MPDPDKLDEAELEAQAAPAGVEEDEDAKALAELEAEEAAIKAAAADPLGLNKMADELTAEIIKEEDAKAFKAIDIPFSSIPTGAVFLHPDAEEAAAVTGMAPPAEVVGDVDADGVPHICFDRVLPDDLAEAHAQLAVEENPANAPHWGAFSPFTLALKVGRLWQPGRTLRVRFIDGNPTVVDRIRAVLAGYLSLISLKFQYVDSGPAEIRVAFRPGQGSWSYVGTECLAVPADEPTMNFGWLTPTLDAARFRQVVLHEFGHALGAIHEHQSPKVQIPWDREAVYRIMGGPPNNWDRATVDNNFFAKYSPGQVDATAFDARSIMCYQFGPPLTSGGFSTPYNTELSPTDRAKLSGAYPRTAPAVDEDGDDDPAAPTPAAGQVLVVGGPPKQGASQSADHPAAFQFTAERPGTYVISATIVRGGNDSPVLELRTAAGALLTSRLGIIQAPLGQGGYGVLVKPRAVLPQPLTFAVRVRKV